MAPSRLSGRELKHRVLEILRSGNLDNAIDAICEMPARQVVNPLFSYILSTDPETKWAAITAMGAVIANLADKDMESARVVVRRLMWQLNDESGGIGWGCPETMGEVVACHEGLAQEYAPVLVSYVKEDGNFLEYEPLQEGAVWGIARAAQNRRHLIFDAYPHLLPFLPCTNAVLRGLAVWALGELGASKSCSQIEQLANDTVKICIYRDRELKTYKVKDLAEEALTRIKGSIRGW